MESLYKNSESSSKGCTDGHRRNEDSSGNFAAIGDSNEKDTDDGCNSQREHASPTMVWTRVQDVSVCSSVSIFALNLLA